MLLVRCLLSLFLLTMFLLADYSQTTWGEKTVAKVDYLLHYSYSYQEDWQKIYPQLRLVINKEQLSNLAELMRVRVSDSELIKRDDFTDLQSQ